MKFMTRLTVGAAVAGAMIGLAGTASAATPATDDVHVNYVSPWYPSYETCKVARAVMDIWHNVGPCEYKHPEGWYFLWS